MRLHLIELHEQTWYPATWRKLFQRGLGQAHSLTDAFGNFHVVFKRFLERLRPARVLDLCSGSGDAAWIAWEQILHHLEPEARPVLVLSDLFPDRTSYERLAARHRGALEFHPEPVDALQPPADAPRVRTLFNALHHFRPEQVAAILGDAARSADGIAVYEVTGRGWGYHWRTLFVLPFAASFLTSFCLRPWRFSHVLWGLLVPTIPVTAVFDGLVSNLRTYTPKELSAIVQTLDAPRFDWEIGTVRVGTTGLDATYLFGWRIPEPSTSDRSATPGP